MITFKNKSILAAIFDMDGTMFDTERLRFETIRQASAEIHGSAIADDVLLGSLGLSAARAEALAKAHHGADYPYAAIRHRADEIELAHVRQHGVPVKAGLYEVLERLKRNGVLLAVATSSRRAIAEEFLITANVFKYFDITVCGDEVARGKPHPEIFHRAAAELNLPPEQCLMVEDSENGLTAAAEAGGLPVLIEDIKPPRPAVAARAFVAYGGMPDFLDDLRACTAILPAPALTEPFPAMSNGETVGIHGFGAMGGGYLAQILSHWDGYTRPAEIIGITGDGFLRELVNSFGRYAIRYPAEAHDQTIDNIRLIDAADEAGIVALYSQAAMIGLSLPEAAIRQQAPLMARGLVARHQAGGGPLSVLTILNKLSGARFVQAQVVKALARLVPADQAQAIMAKTHFPETVVNRMASRLPRDALLRQARIKLDLFAAQSRDLAVENAPARLSAAAPVPPRLDRRADEMRQAAQMATAVGQVNLVLFHSEADMAVYAEKGCAPVERLRQTHLLDDIALAQTVKNRLWNGTHAIAAWYAHLLGYRTIGQGMGDARVAALVDRLLKAEIQPALLAEAPATASLLPGAVEAFTHRCRMAFKDTCLRVGRDPLRKLQRRERIFGAIDLAARHGLRTEALEYGAALGLLFALRDSSPTDKECAQIRQLFEARGQIADVLAWPGPYNGQPYPGLDPLRDRPLIARIEDHLRRLMAQDSQHWDWPLHAATDG